MKNLLLSIILLSNVAAKAQRIDSIYVNLYTDSLKKGTYNYINVDGLTDKGSYMPLDSSHIIFTSNKGIFYGNTLWIEDSMHSGRVDISVCLRKNPELRKTFSIYIKQQEDDALLKTEEEIIADLKKNAGKKNKKN